MADSIISMDEDAIISALKSALPGSKVDTFPGSPEEAFLEPVGPNGAAYILYHGGNFSRNRASGIIDQNWEAEFRILLVADILKSRRDASRGAYAMVDDARAALSGLELPGGGCLEVRSERVFRILTGKYAYMMTFVTKNRSWRK